MSTARERLRHYASFPCAVVFCSLVGCCCFYCWLWCVLRCLGIGGLYQACICDYSCSIAHACGNRGISKAEMRTVFVFQLRGLCGREHPLRQRYYVGGLIDLKHKQINVSISFLVY